MVVGVSLWPRHVYIWFFFSSRRRHTRCALVTGVQTCALPISVACAFLPESPYTRRYADAAHAAGKEVLLHLPLQPIAAKPHPLTLVTSASDPVRDAALSRLLASVPHLDGVNNHEGSLTTSRDRKSTRLNSSH